MSIGLKLFDTFYEILMRMNRTIIFIGKHGRRRDFLWWLSTWTCMSVIRVRLVFEIMTDVFSAWALIKKRRINKKSFIARKLVIDTKYQEGKKDSNYQLSSVYSINVNIKRALVSSSSPIKAIESKLTEKLLLYLSKCKVGCCIEVLFRYNRARFKHLRNKQYKRAFRKSYPMGRSLIDVKRCWTFFWAIFKLWLMACVGLELKFSFYLSFFSSSTKALNRRFIHSTQCYCWKKMLTSKASHLM